MLHRNKGIFFITLLLAAMAVVPSAVLADKVKRVNMAVLINRSEAIMVGRVISVTDGFQGTIPFTEVTLAVSTSIRGAEGQYYTFRQFGLLKPRDMGNGYTNVMTTPDGWPRYEVGEEVILFMFRAARHTGLRSPVGLFQGKFVVQDGQVVNGSDNAGLFKDLRSMVPAGKHLPPEEAAMLAQPHGAVDADTFISFVRRAVEAGWFD